MANNISYNADAHRREQVQQKTIKSSRVLYRYEEDDIRILNGPYEGRMLSEIWKNGSSDDRDYLFSEFWKKDEIARGILMKDCAK